MEIKVIVGNITEIKAGAIMVNFFEEMGHLDGDKIQKIAQNCISITKILKRIIR